MQRSLTSFTLSLTLLVSATPPTLGTPPKPADQTVSCEILVVGGGLAGAATAYESLLAGRTVCLTEITDWVGGQISSQGVSALDEATTQRKRLFFSRGYLELRQRIERYYGQLNPGNCWVSESCFIPRDGHKIVFSMLQDAAKRGKGTLKWFPNTVVKELELTPPTPHYQGGDKSPQSPSYQAGDKSLQSPSYQGGDKSPQSPPYQEGDKSPQSPSYQAGDKSLQSPSYQGGDKSLQSPSYQGGDKSPQSPSYQKGDKSPQSPPMPWGVPQAGGSGQIIQSAIAIQHRPALGKPPLNTEPLSQTIEDAYRYENSPRFDKTILRFVPQTSQNQRQGTGPNWYVVDATETGELIALADVPYRVGLDARSPLEPSAANDTGDPYCTQGYTYTFAMETTKEPQTPEMPSFYPRYSGYYSFEATRFNFPTVFTYRRIWSQGTSEAKSKGQLVPRFGVTVPKPGDISMQNWTWGNDYRPGTANDNLILTRDQLQATGQLKPSGWMGGLRVESLRGAEELAQGYFYWLVAGTTDSRLGNGVKQPQPNNRYLKGLDSPMGTMHGLSKYPYIREARRIIGRPAFGYPEGFTISEIDISRRNFREDYYRQNLTPKMFRSLQIGMAGLQIPAVLSGAESPDTVKLRSRSTIYPDSVGIAHYAIDFHPCLAKSPPETPGNEGYPNEAMGAGRSYPFQIPLRAMIPQKIDNMLVAGKSIATSHITAAAYRVHSFEWSAGAAAGTTADFALEKGIMPYQLVDELPRSEPQLRALQRRLDENGNPTAFPKTSIFNESWQDW